LRCWQTNFPAKSNNLPPKIRCFLSFAPSIIATGAWRSLPFLRNIAKEVEEVKAPFVVPADYFSREAEEALLLAMLEGEPRDIMLLTGPPSSGKTATIARVLQRREERKDGHKVTGFIDPPA
jgi:hypothetical protein